jgi:hypothetical protein
MRWILALASLPVFACPQLAGTYLNCRSTTGATSGVTDLVVTQQGITYVVSATENSTHERMTETFVANGVPAQNTRVIPRINVRANTTITTTCDGQVLKASGVARSAGLPVGDAAVEVRRRGRGLEVRATGRLAGIPVSDTLICE